MIFPTKLNWVKFKVNFNMNLIFPTIQGYACESEMNVTRKCILCVVLIRNIGAFHCLLQALQHYTLESEWFDATNKPPQSEFTSHNTSHNLCTIILDKYSRHKNHYIISGNGSTTWRWWAQNQAQIFCKYAKGCLSTPRGPWQVIPKFLELVIWITLMVTKKKILRKGHVVFGEVIKKKRSVKYTWKSLLYVLRY